ncbi:hypothetical protein FQA47_008082 [Oryzias melastigma]|uniref:Uncharacterized protein n=1 Tax=Oryzias melastigma TaxID=30732 RepID=A0A834CMB0_ORYME|nr:hypothetical protein FQA47_008082 [Oryzias melastigma]
MQISHLLPPWKNQNQQPTAEPFSGSEAAVDREQEADLIRISARTGVLSPVNRNSKSKTSASERSSPEAPGLKNRFGFNRLVQNQDTGGPLRMLIRLSIIIVKTGNSLPQRDPQMLEPKRTRSVRVLGAGGSAGERAVQQCASAGADEGIDPISSSSEDRLVAAAASALHPHAGSDPPNPSGVDELIG